MFKDKGVLLSLTLVTSITVTSIVGLQVISNEESKLEELEKEIYSTNREINASERNVKNYEEIATFLEDFEYSKEYFDSSLNLLHQLKSLEQLMYKFEINNINHEVNNVKQLDDFVEGSIKTSIKAPLNNVLSFLGELYDINPSPTIEHFELVLEEENFLASDNQELVANIDLIYRSKNKDISSFDAYSFDESLRTEPEVNPFGYFTTSQPEENPLEKYKEELKSGTADEPKHTESTIQSIAETEANKAAIDKDLVLALIKVSSNFNPQITLTDNRIEYRGLMGINPDIAPWFAEQAGIEYQDGIEYDTEKNIRMGVFYLSHLKKNNPNLHYIISAYHYGPKGALEVMDKGTYETDFSKRVIDVMNSRSWEEGK